jgi:hypothetical protein
VGPFKHQKSRPQCLKPRKWEALCKNKNSEFLPNDNPRNIGFQEGHAQILVSTVNLANNLANLIPTIKILDYSEEKKKEREKSSGAVHCN